MKWTRDRQLGHRMVLALALSAVGYAALLGPLFLLFPAGFALVVCVFLAVVLAVLVGKADFLTYLATRAVAIERSDHPRLFDTVGRLAAQADMSRPPIAVIATDEPNALSAGTGDRTVVCVTLGLLKTLDDDQLEAVLAHELAHCKNGDSSVLTVAGFPTTVGLAALSTGLDNLDARGVIVGYWGLALTVALLSIPLLVVSLPGTLVLARYREYAADRAAVAITGKPVALAEALATLHGLDRTPERDLRLLGAFNAFCIVPSGTGLFSLPWTHPPVHRRIRALRELQAELSGQARTGR